jgi:MinD superfamily P-loop ATPase
MLINVTQKCFSTSTLNWMPSRLCVKNRLKGTDWGELDVLVLDLPPGTGDVQLAVCQDIQLSGAVAVSTPSKLATVDTRKGIDMFTSLGVPTLAVVENMAYFVVRQKRQRLFFICIYLSHDSSSCSLL